MFLKDIYILNISKQIRTRKGFVVKQQHEGAGAEIQHGTIRTKNKVADLAGKGNKEEKRSTRTKYTRKSENVEPDRGTREEEDEAWDSVHRFWMVSVGVSPFPVEFDTLIHRCGL